MIVSILYQKKDCSNESNHIDQVIVSLRQRIKCPSITKLPLTVGLAMTEQLCLRKILSHLERTREIRVEASALRRKP